MSQAYVYAISFSCTLESLCKIYLKHSCICCRPWISGFCVSSCLHVSGGFLQDSGGSRIARCSLSICWTRLRSLPSFEGCRSAIATTARHVSQLQVFSRHVGCSCVGALLCLINAFVAMNESVSRHIPRSFGVWGLCDLVGIVLAELITCPVWAL